MRMIKRLLILTFSLAALWLVPVTASAAPAYFAGVMELSDEQEVDVVYRHPDRFWCRRTGTSDCYRHRQCRDAQADRQSRAEDRT